MATQRRKDATKEIRKERRRQNRKKSRNIMQDRVADAAPPYTQAQEASGENREYIIDDSRERRNKEEGKRSKDEEKPMHAYPTTKVARTWHWLDCPTLWKLGPQFGEIYPATHTWLLAAATTNCDCPAPMSFKIWDRFCDVISFHANSLKPAEASSGGRGSCVVVALLLGMSLFGGTWM